MRFDSLNGTHPLSSNPKGREKRAGKLGGYGRGMKRSANHFVPTLMQLPATPPPAGAYRVGDRVTGSFMCPACRTRTMTLVYQLPTSTLRWVCADWCSPRDPRREAFVSTTRTNMEAHNG